MSRLWGDPLIDPGGTHAERISSHHARRYCPRRRRSRYAELDDHTVAFEAFPLGVDTTPYIRGLPDGRCTCLHLGYVTAEQITFVWADHEETFVEGDAYVAPPGHTTRIVAGTSLVEFSRTADLTWVPQADERGGLP